MDRRLGAARSEDPDAAQPAPSRAFPRRPLCARSLLLPAALPQLGFKELQAVFSLFEFLLFFFDYFLWRFVGETGFREQISRALKHLPRFFDVSCESRPVFGLIVLHRETDFDCANHGRRAVAT